MWPQYVMIAILAIQFSGDIHKAHKKCIEKAAFIGTIIGAAMYYVFVIWILMKGGFF